MMKPLSLIPPIPSPDLLGSGSEFYIKRSPPTGGDMIENLFLQPRSGQFVHLPQTGRTGDIHLQHMLANDVYPRQNDPFFSQPGCEPGANRPVRVGQFAGNAPASGIDIGSKFPGGRDPADPSQDFTPQQKYPFVPFRDLREEALASGIAGALVVSAIAKAS
jgi:hypothetical protein